MPHFHWTFGRRGSYQCMSGPPKRSRSFCPQIRRHTFEVRNRAHTRCKKFRSLVGPGSRTTQLFLSGCDPNGNAWMLQGVTARLPGRMEGNMTSTLVAKLAATLRRAAAADGQHEKRTGEHDVSWPAGTPSTLSANRPARDCQLESAMACSLHYGCSSAVD